MLNSQLTQSKPGLKTLKFKSPPKALQRYFEASGSQAMTPLDCVELSEAAKSTPTKSSGLTKAAQFVALGVSFMGVMGAVGCSNTAPPVEAETTVSIEQETPAAERSLVSALQDTPTSQRQDTVQTKKHSSKSEIEKQLEREAQTIVNDVKKAGQEIKRVREDLRGADSEEVGRVLGREGQALGQSIVEGVQNEVESTVDDVKKAGQEIKRVRENLRGKNGKEIAQELGKEGKQLGKQIGKEAGDLGKDVGKAAKNLWNGLRGKKNRKKN